MPVIGFNHYNLRAQREMLDKLRDFYVGVVGMHVGYRPLSSFGYWLYVGEQAVLHLSEAGQEEIRLSHVEGTFDHVAFTCTERQKMAAHLEEHGVVYRTSTVSLTGQVQFFFSDPAGNGVELNFKQ